MRKDDSPVQSFAKSNRELLEGFENYLIALNRSANTRRSYLDSVGRLILVLGSKNAADLDRSDIRIFQSQLLAKRVTANSVRLHIAGIRAFSKFLRLAGLTHHDPTLLLSHRKLPSRVPRVLTVEEIESLIAAGETPLERALVEFLDATGCRISELCKLRVEDVDFANRVIRVLKSKGGASRIVLYHTKAAAAIEEYLGDRRSGFLFEAPARTGQFFKHSRSWYARFYDDQFQRQVRLGKIRDLSEAEARAKFERLKTETPGFVAHPARPYDARSIRLLMSRLAFRAGLGRVHPHALRRSFATHLLQGGADIRSVQELLGHTNLSTTMLYTRLSIDDLKAVHTRSHPHAEDEHGKEK